jgi:excinuclease ABC subunit A
MAIEHNPEVTKSADWILDMRPEGGSGELVAQGTTEDIARSEASRFLRKVLARLRLRQAAE